MEQEEFILFSLTNAEKLYTNVERAFGYKNSKKEYMPVAAILADETDVIFFVGVTGHNYGNTAELNVMNYKQVITTVDKKEWDKAIKVDHDKMVKYNLFIVVNWKDLLLEPNCLIQHGQ